MTTWLSRLLLAAALAFGGLGGYLVWQPSAEPQPPLVIGQVDRDLGEVAVGDRGITIRVSNPTGESRRVIGLAEG